MDRTVSDDIVLACKDYKCSACEVWIDSGGYIEDCSTEEQMLVVTEAEADGWKILRGQIYRKVVYVEGGEFATYRARPDMELVCFDLGLYDGE